MASRSKKSSKKGQKGGGFCAVLFGLVFFAAGSAGTWFFAADFKKDLDTYEWTETPCQINDVRIIADQSQGNSPFRIEVAYSYEFEGQSYESKKFTRSEQWSEDYEPLALDRKEILERDQEEFCYVNSEGPAEAVLKRESLAKGFVILFPLVFVAVGLAIMLGGFRAYKKERDTKTTKTHEAISGESATSKSGEGVLLLFGVIFSLVGGGLFIPLGLIPAFRMVDAQNWTETPCKVIWSRVLSHEGDDSMTYSVDIFYEYEFDGHKHQSNRYTFMSGSSSGRSGKTAIVRQYPKGSQQICYVNPELPEQAVILRDFTPWMLLGLLPLIFFFAGVAMLVGWSRSKNKKEGRFPHSSNSYSAGNGLRDDSTWSAPVGDDTPLILKPGGKRLVEVFGVLFFALFWNGIVSVFVWQAVKGFQQGRPEWFLTIFMIPFVLIGLGMIFAFLYKLLSLANPQPILTVNPGAIRLGEEVSVSWELRGNSRRVAHLTLLVQGVESATYRRGTTTSTDNKVFYCKDIFDSADGGGSGGAVFQMKNGRAQFKLPVDLVPSLELSNNKIRWELKVNGDVPLWPDISDTYAIEVLPATFS